ncbi:hypothetical protein QZM22_14715 [Burkholderia oklahomensis]|uniref:hypothetical protein n=1 Tax=Burkholderia oklahomensis TaxID=342113 RepID=UPI00264D9C24|nr:hypothetical protein [Burkholderia oklahomensis]MDN7673734.1 hypothetical protein [Burkholderia oklahomensis]
MNVLRNVLAVLLHVLGSFLAITATMLIVWLQPAMPRWLVWIAALLVGAGVLYAIGAAIGAFRPRLRPVGVALVVSSGLVFFDVLAMVGLRLSPDLLAMATAQHPGLAFSLQDLVWAALAALAIGVAGWRLATRGGD